MTQWSRPRGVLSEIMRGTQVVPRASLDDLAAGSGSASGLLAHVLTGPAHGEPGHPAADRNAGPGGAGHASAAYGVLFSDATALAADPELTEPARNAVRALAAHLADLIQRGQADGGIRADADPQAAAWLLLSVLSARRLRTAAMPADLEPAVTTLALQALAPPVATARGREQTPPDAAGSPGATIRP